MTQYNYNNGYNSIGSLMTQYNYNNGYNSIGSLMTQYNYNNGYNSIGSLMTQYRLASTCLQAIFILHVCVHVQYMQLTVFWPVLVLDMDHLTFFSSLKNRKNYT